MQILRLAARPQRGRARLSLRMTSEMTRGRVWDMPWGERECYARSALFAQTAKGAAPIVMPQGNC